MSKDAAANFVEQLMHNAALQEELDAVLAGAAEASTIIVRTVNFARVRGYDVTADDLAEAGGVVLSDEELAKMSAGAVRIPGQFPGAVEQLG